MRYFVIGAAVIIIVLLLFAAFTSPQPKFKVGQVVRVMENGPYFKIGFIKENGGGYMYTDATQDNPAAGFWPEESLRALNERECGR